MCRRCVSAPSSFGESVVLLGIAFFFLFAFYDCKVECTLVVLCGVHCVCGQKGIAKETEESGQHTYGRQSFIPYPYTYTALFGLLLVGAPMMPFESLPLTVVCGRLADRKHKANSNRPNRPRIKIACSGASPVRSYTGVDRIGL